MDNSEIPLLNCTKLFKFLCPKIWKNLDETADSKVRFCNACQKKVYLCATPEELRGQAAIGNCIALVLSEGAEELRAMRMGRILAIDPTDAESLMRASEVPTTLQQAELLRTAPQGSVTPPEEMLRASVTRRPE